MWSGAAITTEAQYYDRDVPGEWAQATQVYTLTRVWIRLVSDVAVEQFFKSVVCVCMCLQTADSGGEGAPAERGEVKQSRQKHCVGHGGAPKLQVAAFSRVLCNSLTVCNIYFLHTFSLPSTSLCFPQTSCRGDGGRAGENQTVLPDPNISTWEEGSQ